MYKFNNGLLPAVLNTQYKKNNEILPYNTKDMFRIALGPQTFSNISENLECTHNKNRYQCSTV